MNAHSRELFIPVGLTIGLFGTIWIGATSLGKQEEKILQLENRVARWETVIVQLNRIDRNQGIMDVQVKNLDRNVRKIQEDVKSLLTSAKNLSGTVTKETPNYSNP